MGLWDDNFMNELKKATGLESSGSGTTDSQKLGGGSSQIAASSDAAVIEREKFKIECDRYFAQREADFRQQQTRIKLLEKAKIAGMSILLYEGAKQMYRWFNESRRGKN